MLIEESRMEWVERSKPMVGINCLLGNYSNYLFKTVYWVCFFYFNCLHFLHQNFNPEICIIHILIMVHIHHYRQIKLFSDLYNFFTFLFSLHMISWRGTNTPWSFLHEKYLFLLKKPSCCPTK